MSVSRCVSVLLLLGLLCVAPSADAAPFVIGAGGQIAGGSCAAVGVVGGGSDCGLFTVNPFSTTPVDGAFGFDNDVALFFFTLTTQTNFSASTTGFATTGFDPLLGLFYGADTTVGSTFFSKGTIVQVPDPTDPRASIPVKSVDISGTNYDDLLPDPLVFQPATLLLGPGSYVLAMLQFPNNFHSANGLDSLAAGFDLDDPLFRDVNGGCAGSNRCNFSLNFTASPVATVPEPGTLPMLILGVAALAAIRRRR